MGMIPEILWACAEQLHLMGSRMSPCLALLAVITRKEGPKKTHRQHETG